MSFDARSKERLEALGRTLPKKLPLPNAQPAGSASVPSPPAAPGARAVPPAPAVQAAQPPARGAKAARPSAPSPQNARHAVEREEDPIALFRALMAASPDGTVPPHHLERLRELEAARQRPIPSPAARGPSPGTPLNPPSSPAKASASRPTGTATKGKATKGRSGSRRPAQNQAGETDLYTAFAQLLLEDDNLDD